MVEYDAPDDSNRENEQQSTSRIKLWNLKSSQRCAVIGTCLTLAEVRKIARKARLLVPENVNDGRLHSTMVSLSRSQSQASKLVHRALDRKFKQSILQLSRIDEKKELITFWRDGVKGGNVAGPLWGVMTHPLADDDTRRQIYSDVHMMSHLTGRSTQVDIKQTRDLENCVAVWRRSSPQSARPIGSPSPHGRRKFTGRRRSSRCFDDSAREYRRPSAE